MTALRMLWFVLKWAVIYAVSLVVFNLLMAYTNYLLGVSITLTLFDFPAEFGIQFGILVVLPLVCTTVAAIVPLSVLKIRAVASFLLKSHWLWLWLLPLGFFLFAMVLPGQILLLFFGPWVFIFNILFAYLVSKLEFKAQGPREWRRSIMVSSQSESSM